MRRDLVGARARGWVGDGGGRKKGKIGGSTKARVEGQVVELSESQQGEASAGREEVFFRLLQGRDELEIKGDVIFELQIQRDEKLREERRERDDPIESSTPSFSNPRAMEVEDVWSRRKRRQIEESVRSQRKRERRRGSDLFD